MKSLPIKGSPPVYPHAKFPLPVKRGDRTQKGRESLVPVLKVGGE